MGSFYEELSGTTIKTSASVVPWFTQPLNWVPSYSVCFCMDISSITRLQITWLSFRDPLFTCIFRMSNDFLVKPGFPSVVLSTAGVGVCGLTRTA